MNNKNNDPVDRMVEAYETMLERIHAMGERTGPAIGNAIDQARETAVELGELSREEAEKIASYIERDIHDAARFVVETGEDFRNWFRFDVQLVETHLFNLFASVADQTSLELQKLAERARHAPLRTGEVTGPGTLECQRCGEQLHFRKAGRIPPCPKCRETEFKRVSDH